MLFPPLEPETPVGDVAVCNDETSVYTSDGAPESDSYVWMLTPEEAGTLESEGLTASIEWNDDFSDTQHDRVFVIDGKRITMEEFAGMLEPWEVWHLKFKILDRSDDDA